MGADLGKPMVQEQTRTDVWQTWWDAARLTRYYQVIHDRCQVRHKLSMVLILVLGTGSVATLIESLPNWVQAAFGIGLAAIFIWVMVSGYAAKAAMAGEVGYGCQKYESELQNLMARADAPDGPPDHEVRNMLMEIEAGIDRVTARAGDAGMTNDKRLNEKMAIEAGAVLENTSYA